MCFKYVGATNLINQTKQLVIQLLHIHLTGKYIHTLLSQNPFICTILIGMWKFSQFGGFHYI